MTLERALIEKEILDLGALSIQDHLFSHGAFWGGRLDDDRFDVCGRFNLDDSMSESIFDLASTTKALVTTALVLREAWARGHTAVDTLGTVFPRADFSGLTNARSLKLSEVLRHEAGLPAWRNFFTACEGKTQNLKQALNRAIASRHLDHRNVYSDLDMILLGILLETSHGRTLSELFSSFLYDDLNLDSSDLKLGPSWHHSMDQCIDTGYCPVRGRVLRGEVHDENASALGGFTGHTGLFGSIDAVVTYLRALSQSVIGRRIIRENSAWAAMYPKSDSALGWRTARDLSSNTFGEGRGIGHMGFTGTAFWIDPKTNTFAVLLTNRVALGRVSSLPAMREFRRAVFGKIYQYVIAAAL